MESINVYSYIISLFQSVASAFASGMLNSLVSVLKINVLLSCIGMIAIIIFAIKKMQDNDLFTLKTCINICLMLGYLGFFNWAINNPSAYYDSVSYLFEYPSEILSKQILNATIAAAPQASSGDFNGGIDVLLQQALSAGLDLLKRTNIQIGFTGVQGTIGQLLLGIVYFLCTLIFTILVIFIILVAVLQVMIWKSLSIIFLLFMFLPQTRGMVGKYILFVITLTMYKPMVLTVAFFNTSISKYVISNMPSEEAFQKGSGVINTLAANTQMQLSIMGYMALGIIGCLICVFLVKQVPEFLSNVIGTSTSVGKGMATAATGAMAGVMGMAAGIAAGSSAGVAKSAYQAAGGGAGGAASAALGMLSGGASNKLGGNKLGEKANDKINTSKVGNSVNNAISKGISTSTNTIKSLGNKISGKK